MSEEKRERALEEEMGKQVPEEAYEGTPREEGEEGKGSPHHKPSGDDRQETKGGSPEEELREFLEESLERITVSEIVLSMMNQLASIAYLRLGLPESVNLKYRDFEQARLAIDVLDAMIKAGEGKVSPENLKPFRGTLANLQLNFVQLTKCRKEG